MIYNAIHILTGETLVNVINIIKEANYKERYCVNGLVQFCNSRCDGKIAVLHGLRRTGKTVAMKHTIAKLIKAGVSSTDIVYMEITDDVNIYNIYRLIDTLNCKYIFIDEITMANGFISSSAKLSDIYGEHIKIVVAGTDSLALRLAERTSLFDRTYEFRTNKMSFNEFKLLYNKKANSLIDKYNVVSDFISYGATMSPQFILEYKELIRTVDTAIIGNIVHTLIRNKDTELDLLKNLDRLQIAYMVYNYLMCVVCIKSDEQIRDTRSKVNSDILEMLSYGINKEFEKEFTTVGIKGTHSNLIYKCLEFLDIFSKIRNMAVVDKSDNLKINKTSEVYTYCYGLYSNILEYAINMPESKKTGSTMENMIISQCAIAVDSINNPPSDRYRLGFVRYNDGTKDIEVDVAIMHTKRLDFGETDTSYTLIEVKHSTEIRSSHWKNFKEPSLIKMFGDKVNRVIVYNGETKRITDNIGGKAVGIQFINAYEFMTDIEKWIKNNGR